MALVSIVMPLYNGQKYLEECIRSVISQTFTEWELIIIDDGSTDSSLDICKKFAECDHRINVIHQENAGVSAARNNALKKVTGKYVTFIDCDDLYTENRLEVMYFLMEAHPDCECVYSDYYEFKGDEGKQDDISIDISVKIIPHLQYVDDVLLYQKLNSVWRYMLRADIAKEISFNSLSFAEDFFYLLDYAVNVKQAIYTTEKLYYYRKDNTDSMTNNSHSRRYLNDYRTIPVLVAEYISKNKLEGTRYKTKIAREYAYSSVRIRRTVGYSEFKKFMNELEYRKGLEYAEFDKKNKLKGLLFLLIKFKIYLPYLLIRGGK
ncbi:MAG: glycosyltransferase [Oscillospiraceae bacterium]|nr:glycosyltransferase [Oscillospiraceae bacterium]